LGGPSYNETALARFAAAIGGNFIADQSAFSTALADRVEVPHAGGVIVVRSGTVALGRAASPLSEVTFQFPATLSHQVELAPDGFIRRIQNKLFRVTDLFAGDDGFDKAFSVSGSDRAFVKSLFENPALRTALLSEPSLTLSLSPAEATAGGSVLELKIHQEIADPDRLTKLVRIVQMVIDKVKELDAPDGLVDLGLHRLQAVHPELMENAALDRALRTQFAWAVSKETQVCHEVALNTPPDQVANCLKDRAASLRSGDELPAVTTGRRGPGGWMKDPREILDATLERIDSLAGDSRPAGPVRQAIVEVLRELVAAEAEICLRTLATYTPTQERPSQQALAPRTRADRVVCDAEGRPIESRTKTERWGEWYSGLDNDHRTLREVYSTLPGFPPEKVPEIIRKFENPESPVALPGAVTLLRHDLIHILVGRGLLDQDEAFVIGFTMGTCREQLRASDESMMETAFSELYPEPYRIARPKLDAFKLGVEVGRSMGIEQLSRFPIENYMDTPIGEIRKMLEIDVQRLRDIYRTERAMIPGTLESARLPI
jgi:hypothetical protein